MNIHAKLSPFLWYSSGAEDAVAHYLQVFGSGRIKHTQRWGENAPGAAGTVMLVDFELLGLPLLAFNGGTHFKLNEAVSLVVACEDQAEIDRLWEQLPGPGGSHQACGWLKDAWGLSWQLVPKPWFEMIRDPDSARVQRVFQAIWAMTKPDLAALHRAYEST
jgi:predicted 3-demethylubiquinone-9 3-methyltransferase (glyoxalase superfamily)